MLIPFDNTYARLPERFYARLSPTPVTAPRLVKLNTGLALELGLDPDILTGPEGIALLAGNSLVSGVDAISQTYAGHQFGTFVPQLGDGRAILLGEVVDKNGKRWDIQLKGSGPTPFSRRGDGRAALGPVLREYIVGEAMAALGVPTTRALAAVATGETVWREEPIPGAVLTRVASSHIRIGTFQYFAARGDGDAIRRLADYAIARHDPDVVDASNPYRAFLDRVIARQADLIARWLLVGFIHGVMNTDNMSVSGETIDYGPCAFMDAYHPETVFSSIDETGRYAYANQPAIAQWNLTRFAESLLPLLGEDENVALREAEAGLALFAPQFNDAYVAGLRRKLGLSEARENDFKLAQDLFGMMAESGADFTLTFRLLCSACEEESDYSSLRSLFSDGRTFDGWMARWRARLADEEGSAEKRHNMMLRANPVYIPRNHLVEEAIRSAVHASDFAPFERMLAVLSAPYDEQSGAERYAEPPQPHEIVRRTFCGT